MDIKRKLERATMKKIRERDIEREIMKQIRIEQTRKMFKELGVEWINDEKNNH